MARPALLWASPTTSWPDSTQSISSARAPRRWAARAAAGGPIWRKPAVPMARRQAPHWPPLRPRSGREGIQSVIFLPLIPAQAGIQLLGPRLHGDERMMGGLDLALELDHHPVLGRLVRELGPAREHIVAH